MFERLFHLKEHKTDVKTEILAGVTTFLAMAYILAVNPNILSACGMDRGGVLIATALASFVGTVLMAMLANYPFVLAPGMGLNAYFAFTVCLTMGYSWQFALAAVYVEGALFLLLSLLNIREAIFNAIPLALKSAVGVGIGLFIAFIALQNAHIIVDSSSNLMALGDILTGSALLCIIGLAITSVLLIYRIKGAMLLGILFTTIIGIPLGETHLSGIVGMPPDVTPLCMQFEWDKIFTLDMFLVVLTFLFFDMFDTIGTVIGVMSSAGMIKKDGTIPRVDEALLADAIATTAGACVGASTTTTYVESASGVGEGGKTGLTACSIAMFFLVSLFFAPLFLAIPAGATSPALIIVGLMMFANVRNMPFKDYAESIPCFITLFITVMAASISDGIFMGIISYVTLNVIAQKWERLNPTIVFLAIIFIFRYIFV